MLAILPINGTNSMLNNNYLLNIRWDYLLHALVYIPLVPLIMLNNKPKTTNPKQKILNLKQGTLNIILISLIFAFSLEGVQYFLSYRAFNINDLVANGVGVGLGFLIITVFPLERIFQLKFKN